MSFGGGVAVLAELLGELGVPPVGVVLAEAIIVDAAAEPAGPDSYVGGRRSAAAACQTRLPTASGVPVQSVMSPRSLSAGINR